ncbi:MAG: alanine racemase [Clostridiales bacterium]|nr:alanine racemase [Clostridiales bacterium]
MLTLTINVNNLIHNIKFLRQKTSAEFCAVVKANAYGHGLVVAKYINDYVDSFAVAQGEEAVQLRKFTAKPIYVLSPSVDVGDNNIIYSAMSKNDLRHKRVCVKINTGMNRLGILPEEANSFLKLCSELKTQVDSIYTHFSDVEYAPVQLERFMSVKGDYKRHAAASNFIKLDKSYHLDMVRCGLALYGYGDPELKPAMSAYTEVYNVLSVKAGDKIGYSNSAPRDMTVAVLGAGYADCIRRKQQSFYIGGKICATVGNICMDMCLVDVSGLKVKAGDRAEYLCENIGGETIAQKNNTIVYEILTSFGSRCRRIYEQTGIKKAIYFG